MRIGRIASGTLGLFCLALTVTAGVLWVAAVIGILPFANWLQTAGGGLMLFFVGSALVVVASSVLYGLYYALRHFRDWPRGAHLTMNFLQGKAAADLVRALLVIVAVLLLFGAARTYYGCHFAHGCWSMRMMARSDNKVMEFAASGIAVWAFVTWLRVRR